jgi:adenylate cyclase
LTVKFLSGLTEKIENWSVQPMIKDKLWLLQIPIVLLFTGAYYVTELGLQGELQNHFLRETLYPKLQRIATTFSDEKFAVRGAVEPKNKIVIVEVDSDAIDHYGRWPWHRNFVAQLIENVFSAGAKVVGMDMVFSEPDTRISPEIKQFLTEKGMADQTDRFETDHDLTLTIEKHSKNLVLGMASEALCRPDQTPKSLFDKKPDAAAPDGGAPAGAPSGEVANAAAVPAAPAPAQEVSEYACPVAPEGDEVVQNYPKGFDKFALPGNSLPDFYDVYKSPAWVALTFLANIDEYNGVATHSAYFNVFPDQDQIIRRIPLVMMYNHKPFSSLPLEMARVALDEKIEIQFNSRSRIDHIKFVNSDFDIPVTPAGTMEINFRGKGHSFTYVSASEMMNTEEKLEDIGNNRKLAGISKKDVLKDALVFVGVTALGTNDMRAFPTDSNVAGVEGHANILDNLLSRDMLSPGYRSHSGWLLCLMVFGALAFAFAVQKLEAVPALLLFIGTFLGFGIVDFKVLFNKNVSLNSSFFYLETFTIFFVILAAKYIIEERSKKFVRSAFAKYVAPAVVDSILKNPEKLVVGGLKKDLTIMFSDIRSFTTFSEKMDAPKLAQFLNDYLGIMTKLVFANEGTLDKYIGDAIMAFWGAPLDQPFHAANACKAAVAMMQALHANKERWKTEFDVDVNIGVGINSGPVNVGNMGSSDNFSYTVIGDHVNLSSRLEGLTKAYMVSILTTRFTFDEIVKAGGELPPHRVLDNVKVKGKKNAVELIQVLDRPLAKEGLVVFEDARQMYLQQRWDLAIARFREANSYLAHSAEEPDGPCEMFVERCQEFKINPPAKDWDGDWEMHSK